MKMETKLSLSPLALAMLLASALTLSSCGKPGEEDVYDDGINWDGSNSGTLELINGSSKDMILFIGQTPAPSNRLGGVRAGATTTHDISGLVSDFAIGGYAVLRGVSKDEYEKHSDDPAKAKIEFTAMVTYKSGSKYRYNIDRSFTGDNAFRVGNRGRIGMELRKDGPDGEKVAYLPALATNVLVYTQTTDAVSLFPVYVFFNKTTGEVSTLRAQSHMETITAAPRPVTANNSDLQTYYMPSGGAEWSDIVGSLKQSAAYLTIVNGVPNQTGYVTVGASKRLFSQNGFNAIGSGERLTYQYESTDDGLQVGLMMVFFNGLVMVPIRSEGELIPTIRNGYDYSISITFLGGKPDDVANYRATIVESEKKRDVSDQIESL